MTSESSGYVSVHVTAASRDKALALARSLVDEGLAGCVNVVGGVTSVYRWEGVVQEDDEALLLIKTKAALFDALARRVVELHEYDVPCVVALPVLDGHAPYLRWLDQNVRPRPAGS